MKRLLAALMITVAACVGCTSAPEPDSSSELSGTITVLAASSLVDSFRVLADQFEQEHPKVTVELSVGGSSGLALAIMQGAPADVFASASEPTMVSVTKANLAIDPVVFAHNSMTVAVPTSNPGQVNTLRDLARPEVKVVVCDQDVPCGAAALEVQRKSGITIKPVSTETNVKSVLTKVSLGEADAGLVYVTDIGPAGENVTQIRIPQQWNTTIEYPIAVLKNSPNPRVAQAFHDFVTSPAGQKHLAEAGFTP